MKGSMLDTLVDGLDLEGPPQLVPSADPDDLAPARGDRW
jgi:hypothetical protein